MLSQSSVLSTPLGSMTVLPPLLREDMQIFVKGLSGYTFTLTVNPSHTVEQLKALISTQSFLPASKVRLVHAGRQLWLSTATLESCNITREATIHMLLPLLGGMAPPKRARCDVKDCREYAQKIVGECDFCNGKFCGKHRLLEDHSCSGLEDCRRESHERNANQLEANRTTTIKGV